MKKMEKNLAEVASTGGGTAADALDRMGLKAADLTEQDPAKAFEQLVGALGAIQNPAERMKDAMDIFGKGSSGILNMAVQGSEGLAAMEADADKLGITFSDMDAAKVDEADDAMTAIWETVAGVGRTLAIDLAPWITEVATRFLDWMKSGVDAGSMVTQSLDWVINALGYVADVVQVAETAFDGFRAVFTEGISYIVGGIDKMIKGFSWLYEKLTGTKLAVTDFFAEWSKGLEQSAVKDLDKAGKVWGKEWAHNTVREFVKDVKAGAEGRAAEAVDKAKKFRGGAGDSIEQKGNASAAKAMELGSSEATNTILRTRYGDSGKDMKAVATHTKRTADGVDKMVAQMAAFTGQSELEVMTEFSR